MNNTRDLQAQRENTVLGLIADITRLADEMQALGVDHGAIQAVQNNTMALKAQEAAQNKVNRDSADTKKLALVELCKKPSDKGGDGHNCMLLSLRSDLIEDDKRTKAADTLRKRLYNLYDVMLGAADDNAIKVQLKNLLALKSDVTDPQLRAFKNLKQQFKVVAADIDNEREGKAADEAHEKRKQDICTSAIKKLSSLKSNPINTTSPILLALVERRRINPQESFNAQEAAMLAAYDSAEDSLLLQERKKDARFLDTADMVIVSTMLNKPIFCVAREKDKMSGDLKIVGDQTVMPDKILGPLFPSAGQKDECLYLVNDNLGHYQTFEPKSLEAYVNAEKAWSQKISDAESAVQKLKKQKEEHIQDAVDSIQNGPNVDEKKTQALLQLEEYSNALSRLYDCEHAVSAPTASAPSSAAATTAAVSAPSLPAKYAQGSQAKSILSKEERAIALQFAADRQLFDVMWVMWNQGGQKQKLYDALKNADKFDVIVLDDADGEPFKSSPAYIYCGENFKAPTDDYDDAKYKAYMKELLEPYLAKKDPNSGLYKEYQTLVKALDIPGVLEPTKTAMTDVEYEQKLKASASTTESLASIGWRIHQNTRASAGYLASEIERQEAGGGGPDATQLGNIRAGIYDYRGAKTDAENTAAKEVWDKDPKNKGKTFVPPQPAPVAYDPKAAIKSPVQIKMEQYVAEKKGGVTEQQVIFRAKGNVSVQKLMADFNDEMAAYFKVDSHLIDHQGEKYALRLHAEGGKINLRMFKAGDKDAKPVEIPTAIYQRYEGDIRKAWEKVSGDEVKRHVSRP